MSEEQEHKVRSVEHWPLERLIPYEKNAKKHPKEQIDGLVKIIKEVGFQGYIEVTPDGTVVNGHGRLLAAKQLGFKTVPVGILDEMTDEQIKLYRMADNRVVSQDYDTELLMAELREMQPHFDMTGIFSSKELEFSAEDLGEIDLGALSDDISTQVVEQASDTQKSIDGETEREVPLVKIVGFTKVPADMQRVIGRLQAHAEQVTGETGASALGKFAAEHLNL